MQGAYEQIASQAVGAEPVRGAAAGWQREVLPVEAVVTPGAERWRQQREQRDEGNDAEGCERDAVAQQAPPGIAPQSARGRGRLLIHVARPGPDSRRSSRRRG